MLKVYYCQYFEWLNGGFHCTYLNDQVRPTRENLHRMSKYSKCKFSSWIFCFLDGVNKLLVCFQGVDVAYHGCGPHKELCSCNSAVNCWGIQVYCVCCNCLIPLMDVACWERGFVPFLEVCSHGHPIELGGILKSMFDYFNWQPCQFGSMLFIIDPTWGNVAVVELQCMWVGGNDMVLH